MSRSRPSRRRRSDRAPRPGQRASTAGPERLARRGQHARPGAPPAGEPPGTSVAWRARQDAGRGPAPARAARHRLPRWRWRRALRRRPRDRTAVPRVGRGGGVFRGRRPGCPVACLERAGQSAGRVAGSIAGPAASSLCRPPYATCSWMPTACRPPASRCCPRSPLSLSGRTRPGQATSGPPSSASPGGSSRTKAPTSSCAPRRSSLASSPRPASSSSATGGSAGSWRRWRATWDCSRLCRWPRPATCSPVDYSRA